MLVPQHPLEVWIISVDDDEARTTHSVYFYYDHEESAGADLAGSEQKGADHY